MSGRRWLRRIVRNPSSQISDIRPDIQALRALAVVSVLLYHLWPQQIRGGYVGVDVFFVISGFLIGSHLLAELAVTGRIRLAEFWARRAKRLLPASLTVLLSVALFSVILMPLGERTNALVQIIGSAFYVQNWVLAGQSVDYLSAEEAASPVQHYWTLSVEEQFYIVVPLIIVLYGALLRGQPWARRGRVVALIGLLTAISFGYSVSLTRSEGAYAYFSTATRAWEFGVGVLLAAAAVSLRPWLRRWLGWAGLIAVLTAVALFTSQTAFPGWAAALPVFGAVAMIAAQGAGPMGMLGRMRPVTWIGDLSYSIYLWHWPLIVLVPYATGEPLSWLHKLLIVVVTWVLAWATTHLIEDPVRFSPHGLGDNRTPFTVGVWLAAASVVVTGLTANSLRLTQDTELGLQAAADRVLASAELSCLGAGYETRRGECPPPGDQIVPDPATARDDDPKAGTCWSGPKTEDLRMCRLPDRDKAAPREPGDRKLRVAVLGDSHNDQFLPAFELMAERYDWDVDVANKAACGWADPQDRFGAPLPDDRRERQCILWREQVADRLADTEPYDLIITSQKAQRLDEQQRTDSQNDFEDTWRRQIERGAVVVAIRDTPYARSDVRACVEQHRDDPAQCNATVDDAFGGADVLPPAASEVAGAVSIDLTDTMCDDETCDAVIGGVLVYRDPSHITATFAATLGDILSGRVYDAFQDARREAGR